MTWVRLDDGMPLHPKILRLSDGAFRLWVNGLAFANRATTDGRIDKALVGTLNHHGKWSVKQITGFISELVPGLWIDAGDHYQIHDYEHHQAEAMKQRVERKRANERDKKRKQREDKEGKQTGTHSAVPPNVPRGQSGGHPRVGTGESSVPSRPVPSSLRSDSARTKSQRSPLESFTAFEAVESLFSEMRQAAGGGPFRIVGASKDHTRVQDLVAWAEAHGTAWHEDREAFIAPLRSALEAFFADERAATQAWPLAWFSDPGKYLGAAMKGPGRRPDAGLLAEQQAATAEYDRAITEGRHDDALRWKRKSEEIAAKRRQIMAAERRVSA